MDVQAAQGGTGACQRRLLIAENKLNISEIIWLEDIVDKLKWKHNVDEYEVIEIFNNKPLFRFVEKGHRKDENVYAALGQTNSLFFNSSSVATNVKPGDTITFKIRNNANSAGPMEGVSVSIESQPSFVSMEATLPFPPTISPGDSKELKFRVQCVDQNAYKSK